MHNKYIAPTYGNRGLNIVRGEGVFLFDDQGKRYIDCFSNMGVNILGHAHPKISKTVCNQINELSNLHVSFMNEKRTLLAKKLVEVSDLDKVFFCNSGTESIEAAIKFSRLATNKTELIAARMGYHGKTMGSLSLTKTMKKYNEPYQPLLQHVKHFIYNNIESLKEIISEKTAAVILEPIQGEGGIKIPHIEFFKQVRELCDKYGALLIIDEVQTGMGRTGKMFAIEHYDIKPDIMCLAKGLAGGIPIGATLITNSISEKLFGGCHTNTFGGNPLACATGLATLEAIEKNNLVENAKEIGEYFITELKNINSPIVRDVRGKGLMIAVEIKTKNTKYAKLLQENGVIVIPTLANILRFLPPIIFTKENVDEVVEIVKQVLN